MVSQTPKIMTKEKDYLPMSGYSMAMIIVVMLVIGIAGLSVVRHPAAIFFLVAAAISIPGFFFVTPNASVVLVLFGDTKAP